MEHTILLINTFGLSVGFAGAFLLVLITPQLVTLNKDGSMSMGAVRGADPELARKRNRRLRAVQKVGMPICYFMIASGFAVQLFALWLPKFCGK